MTTGLARSLSLAFAALFVIHGAQLTYLPVWLDARGLTAAEIAIATSAPTFVRLGVTPAIAVLADRFGAHRDIVRLLAWTGLGLMLVLSRLTHPALIVLGVIAMLVTVQSIMPLLDTLSMRAVRTQGLDYGRIRLWGSASFILASYLAGFWTAAGGPHTIIWLLIAGAVLTAAAAQGLPSAAGPSGGGAAALTSQGVLALATTPVFLVFLVAAGATQASHAMFYVFGVIHWRAQGLSAPVIGTLWGISVVAEIALFWASGRITRLGASRLLLVGALAGIARWTAMALDPPVALLFPLQILHAGSFAATHLGAMHWIGAYVPDRRAGTAQALFSTVSSGIGMGGAMLLSGWLYPTFGGAGYVGMALLCALGGLAALALRTLPLRPITA